VDGEERRGIGAQRRPRRGVDPAGRGKAARLLEREHRAPHVGAEPAVDLARREPGPVQQDLRPHHRRAVRSRRRGGVAASVPRRSARAARRVGGRGSPRRRRGRDGERRGSEDDGENEGRGDP
jgi:hypothetical protein